VQLDAGRSVHYTYLKPGDRPPEPFPNDPLYEAGLQWGVVRVAAKAWLVPCWDTAQPCRRNTSRPRAVCSCCASWHLTAARILLKASGWSGHFPAHEKERAVGLLATACRLGPQYCCSCQ
jgi:hypothetical protein